MAVKPIKHIINTALILSLALGASIAAAAETDITAVTIDGRQVLLKADNTWEFIEVTQGDPSVSAVLTVSRIWDMDKACKLQFRLQNNLSYRISTLVPRLTVTNREGVIYDSKSIAFASIKPTNDKYTEVQFERIGCQEISHVRVHDAARCRMGDIDQWNEKEGECLSHIYVEPSDLINISK
ncbi:MAG: hypothetical protein KDI33_08390 [Halioglobus sp.]|nr:hypothetical protein [Halioglobus sp.]